MKRSILRKMIAALGFILILISGRLTAEDQKESSAVTATVAFKLTGYTQGRYAIINDDYLSAFNNSGPSTFQLYRARFGLDGEVFKNIRFKVLFEAARTPMLLDALIEYELINNVHFRIGQFKVPFSQENLLSAALLDTINFSQIVSKLVPGRDNGSSGRDIGAMAVYKYGTAEAMVGVFNGSGINKSDPDEKKDFAGRLTWGPWNFLSVGGSVYLGHTIPAKTTIPISKRNRYGLEMAFNYSRFMVKSEFIYGMEDIKSSSGWYLMGGYFAMPKKLQVIVRYDSYDKDRKFTGNRSDIVLFGANWFFTARTKFQINCELGKLENKNVVFSALLGQFQVGF